MAATNHSSGKPGGSWNISCFYTILCYFLLGIHFLSLFGDSALLEMDD